MTWEFTPTQVMKGEVNYTFDDFRRDLFEQVKLNFADRISPEKLEGGLNVFWIFCHLVATTKSLDEIEKILSELKPPMNRKFLELLNETFKDEIKMLEAIYQNLFLKYFTAALGECWGDEEKATTRAISLVNLYINRHLRL